jgi:tetratricopeptide (TPR) repeat protein
VSRGGTAIASSSESRDERGSAGSILHDAIRQGRSFSGRERNCSFLNLRNGKFADISPVSGLDFPDDGRAVARVDWDHDGDLDFWVVNRSGPQVRFLRNDVPQENNFLVVRLQGRTCNRDAIGARVELHMKGETVPLIRTLSAGDGFLAQSSKSLHFGLGEAAEITRLIVRWPGGKAEEFSGLQVNGHYDVIQQSGQATRRPPRAALALKSSPLAEPPSSGQSEVISMSKLPMPRLDYVGFDGRRHRVSKSMTGGPPQGVLINLWASWCVPCMVELKEWSQRSDELHRAGIRVVALSVDGLSGDKAAAVVKSKKVIDQIKFPFEAGMATANTIEKLQMVNDHLFDISQALPVPTSILVAPGGEISAIYKGKADLDHLLADVKRLRSGTASQTTVLAGRWLKKPQASNPFKLVWQMLEMGFLNEAYEYIKRHDTLLTQHPEYPNLLTLAGNGQLARGQAQQALTLYRKALKINPNYVDVQNNLAWLLATHPSAQIRNGAEALRLAEAVVKRQGQIPSCLDTLAAAYAEVGRYPEALATAKKAVEIATSQGDTQLAQSIQSRINKYASAKPWREK